MKVLLSKEIDSFLNSFIPSKRKKIKEVFYSRNEYLKSHNPLDIQMANIIFQKHEGNIMSHKIDNTVFFLTIHKQNIYYLSMSEDTKSAIAMGLSEAISVLKYSIMLRY